jgi:hypothetical protein
MDLFFILKHAESDFTPASESDGGLLLSRNVCNAFIECMKGVLNTAWNCISRMVL